MRLTLRTLLAYMDGILDPEQQAELEEQVQASPEAKELIHRARDTMRRLRLAAPGMDDPAGPPGTPGTPANGASGKHPRGQDPFSADAVAEYLDNSAASQDVVDLELECLKSDKHLAEVAACHQILTMVLAERAEVDPETRRRMYAIPEVAARVNNQQAGPGRANQSAPPTPSAAAETHASAEHQGVPDYLRASRGGTLTRWAPAVAALLLLSLVSYAAFRPGGWLNPPGRLAADDLAKRGPSPATSGSDAAAPSGEEPTQTAPEPASPEQAPVKPATPDETAEPANSPAAEAAPAPPAATTPATTPIEPPVAIPAVTPDLPALIGPDQKSADLPNPDSGGPGEGPSDDAANTTDQADNPTAADPQAAADALAKEPASEPAANPTPPEPTAIGLLGSPPREVLLRYSPESETWQRLPPRTAIMSGDRLLSLPTYHPTLSLESGLNLELVDGAELLVAPDASGVIRRVELVYGRVIMTNAAAEPVTLILTVGHTVATLNIAGRSVVAAEVDRPFTPGADPRTQRPLLSAVFYAPRGGVEWSTADGSGFAVDQPSAWRLLAGRVTPPEPLKSAALAPADRRPGSGAPTPTSGVLDASWINERVLTYWQREATDGVQEQIDAENPAWPQLMTIFVGSRLKEERALAAASSVHVGHYDPFVKTLRDPELAPVWSESIANIRSAMARSPQAAREVMDVLTEAQGPEQAAEMYEMLIGYAPDKLGATPEQWAAGPIGVLVGRLKSEQLEYRVLANDNLELITGRLGNFSPARSEKAREKMVRRFESWLERGELKPKATPQVQ